MLKKFMRFILGIFGALIGYQIVHILGINHQVVFSWKELDSVFLRPQFIGIVSGWVVGFFLISYLIERLLELILNFEGKLKEITWKRVVTALLGLITGIIFGAIINFTFSIPKIPRVGMPIQILINLIFAYLGLSFSLYKEDEIGTLIFDSGRNTKNNSNQESASYKILDTSVIIDGRIADICKSGFIEGVLIIPEFVLEELRHIADSSDVLKRNRGRRGLDILKQMQKDPNIKVEIFEQDFDDIQEVDSKLVKLAQVLGARVITNDYNLNKVAELQGVNVLNINELANAVKPIVLPGEEMDVKVIKEGKEDGQGVGYLDDGTMIVVDNGINYMGEKVSVLVTSILQTAAGRMIFAKPKAQEQVM
ncbi:PIN/TRAM domain-containing protein [Halothermothrix orenii]|uniref:PilT protein domain protein n=1 Tax=Halothermothrix orenii (strain H 168 / OCM 544 / DSM 9562) TaxID=373903 RepID=B8D098_HALOH|nr:PIN/TRAM domain-containing protein [Halothermothrix orenii]ACL68852.1 PilT protein domain protein [Halothermothrix orenii H 168]